MYTQYVQLYVKDICECLKNTVYKIIALFPVVHVYTGTHNETTDVKSARCHICSTVSSAGSAGSPGWLWQYLAADSCASLTCPLLRCSNTDTKSAYVYSGKRCGSIQRMPIYNTHTHARNYANFVFNTNSVYPTFVSKCTSGELWLSLIHSSLTLAKQCSPWRETHAHVGTYIRMYVYVYTASVVRERSQHASCLDLPYKQSHS